LVVVTIQAAADRLAAFGLRPGQVRSLAITMLASLEGAFVLPARCAASTSRKMLCLPVIVMTRALGEGRSAEGRTSRIGKLFEVAEGHPTLPADAGQLGRLAGVFESAVQVVQIGLGDIDTE
jgi:hypothetical protein